MRPYTLSATTLSTARDFYYRTCVFEALHLPFVITLLVLSFDRFASGRIEDAVEDLAINLAVNAYPVLHHRDMRWRILRLLSRKESRPDEQ